MNTCKPQKISLLDNTNCLLPNDIIPVVQKGTNRTISAKNLIDLIINRIKDILPGSSEAMCIAVEAKKLAEQASADATLALKNLASALAYATKAYQLACLMDARILALEGDHALIVELLDALALLTRQVNINTLRINDIINSNILKITTDANNNYTIYTFYVDSRKIGEIKVPKPKEYTGSQHIDINEERVISLKGLANVAFTGDYNDLSNRPTKLTDFYIDIDFLKERDLEDIEDRITDLEECCEELHSKPNKLISKLIECENPFIDYNGRVYSLTYDVFIDINTINDTEYVIPSSETWDDIVLPNSTHTITVIISTPYWGRNLTLYNNKRLIPMSLEYVGRDNIQKWSAKLTDIRGNVILTGKIFNGYADESDIKIIDINSGKELDSGVNDIGLMPGQSLLRENGMDVEVRPYDDTIIFDEYYTRIAYLIPNTNWANIEYEGPSSLSLEITEAPSYGVIYISGILEVPQSTTVYHSINIKKLGLGNGTITGPTRVEDSSLYNAIVTPDLDSIVKSIKFFTMDGSPLDPGIYDYTELEGIIIDSVTEDISIVITFDLKTPEQYTVSLDTSLSSASVTPTTILLGTSLNATITPPTGYNVTITKATVNGNLVPIEVSGNLVTINSSYITGNVVLYGSLTNIPTSTTVTNKITNAHFTIGSTEYSTTTTIPLNLSVVIQISPNTNYVLDGDVTVTHGSLVLTANASNNYTVSIANVLNSIVITGRTKQSSYSVTASRNFATAISTIEPSTVVAGSNNTIEISPKTNYILTGITNITEGGYSVISDSRVSYRKSGNNYIITFNDVLGDIVIDGTAQQLLTYSVSLAGDLKDNGTALSPTSVKQNNTLEAIVTNTDGVFITEVSMGGTTLLESDYTLTQNSFTNSTITIQNVTGNVVITGCRGIRGYNDDPQLSKEFNWYDKAATYSGIPRTMFLIVGNNLDNDLLAGSVEITNSNEFIARSRYRGANSDFPYDEVWLDVAPWELNITMNEKTTDASITYNGVTKTITGITLTANPKSGYCFMGESNAKYTAEEMSLHKIINLPLNSRPGAPSSEKLAYNFIYHLSQENVRSNDGAYAGYGAPPESMTITVLGLTITIPTDNLPTYLEVNNTSYEISGISWGKVYYNYCESYIGNGFALNCDGTENKNSLRGSTGIDIRFYFLVNEGATGTFTATFTPPLYPDEDAISSPRAKTINMSVR